MDGGKTVTLAMPGIQCIGNIAHLDADLEELQVDREERGDDRQEGDDDGQHPAASAGQRAARACSGSAGQYGAHLVAGGAARGRRTLDEGRFQEAAGLACVYFEVLGARALRGMT